MARGLFCHSAKVKMLITSSQVTLAVCFLKICHIDAWMGYAVPPWLPTGMRDEISTIEPSVPSSTTKRPTSPNGRSSSFSTPRNRSGSTGRSGTRKATPPPSQCTPEMRLRNALQQGYNEELARKYMLPLSAAAYSKTPGTCLNRTFGSNHSTIWELLGGSADDRGRYSTPCLLDSDSEHCTAFLAVSHCNRALMLSFSGSTGPEQVLQIVRSPLAPNNSFMGGGNVMNYFSVGLDRLWTTEMLGTHIQAVAQRWPEYNIWVTGHSLGGALATVAAGILSARKIFRPRKIHLYTFGQPRTGDPEFARAIERLVPHTYRITHGNDLVTVLPPREYKLLGTSIRYRHPAYEVWYDNDMSSNQKKEICPEDRDNTPCSWTVPSVTDHLTYFGHSFWSGSCASPKRKSRKLRVRQ